VIYLAEREIRLVSGAELCLSALFSLFVFFFFLSLPLKPKVDSNEKLGGSGRTQLFSYSLALWRLRVICNLNVSFCVKILFPFPLATAY
jgi:hypothetical protein